MSSTLIREAVNLDRYPIDAPDGHGYRELMAACRADMARSGACVLEDFLLADALPPEAACVLRLASPAGPTLGSALAHLESAGLCAAPRPRALDG